MHRLFVAIRPPRPVRDRLLGAMGGIAGARWQTDDQLHITLRFIGEVDSRQAEDVDLALRRVRFAPFDIAVKGVGSFERRGQPTALWAGVEPAEPLHALHKKVDQACVQAGLEPERRAYRPHITLARLRASARSAGALFTAAGDLSCEAFPVDQFGLYESVLTPDGAVYSLVERYALD